MNPPNCYKCVYRENIPGDAHSQCVPTPTTKVTANPHGVRNGWFFWPYNYDPVWLISCNSFKNKYE